MNHDIALKIYDSEPGLYSADILDLFNRTRALQVFPITVEGRFTDRMAMGFMTPEAAYELNYHYEELQEFISGILDREEPLPEDHTYHYGTLSIYLA